MRPSLWPPTLAAIPLAFGIAWLAHWLLLLIGWRIRAADHIAYVVWSVAVPVIWIALVVGTAMLRARRIGAATTFGSARWMDRRSVRRMTRGSGLIIGRENRRRGRLLRYGGPAHLITLAPTRTGKGVGTIIPNLLAVGRSMLVVDPKGENAAAKQDEADEQGFGLFVPMCLHNLMWWIGDQSIGQERGILGRIGGGGIDPVEGVAAGGGATGDPERVEHVQRSEE